MEIARIWVADSDKIYFVTAYYDYYHEEKARLQKALKNNEFIFAKYTKYDNEVEHEVYEDAMINPRYITRVEFLPNK